MEIKITGGMPLWLCRILNDLGIYPISFSKYGVAYQIKEGYRNSIGSVSPYIGGFAC